MGNSSDVEKSRVAQVVPVGYSIKHIFFDSMLPAFALQKTKVTVSHELATGYTRIDQDHYEVQLRINSEAVGGHAEHVFSVLAIQVGVFRMHGVGPSTVAWAAGVQCAQILYRILCPVIEVVVHGGGYGKLEMPEIDFNALYQAQVRMEDGADTPRLH